VPKRSPKLPTFAVSGGIDWWTPLLAAAQGESFSTPSLPEIEISRSDWERIQEGYGRELSVAQRKRVLDATSRFVYWQELERRAEPRSNTKKALLLYAKAASNLRSLLGRSLEASDAEKYALILIHNEFDLMGVGDRLPWLVSDLEAFLATR
jgi:hypothetical protein